MENQVHQRMDKNPSGPGEGMHTHEPASFRIGGADHPSEYNARLLYESDYLLVRYRHMFDGLQGYLFQIESQKITYQNLGCRYHQLPYHFRRYGQIPLDDGSDIMKVNWKEFSLSIYHPRMPQGFYLRSAVASSVYVINDLLQRARYFATEPNINGLGMAQRTQMAHWFLDQAVFESHRTCALIHEMAYLLNRLRYTVTGAENLWGSQSEARKAVSLMHDVKMVKRNNQVLEKWLGAIPYIGLLATAPTTAVE